QPEPADEGVGVVAEPSSGRRFFEFRDIATADDDVFRTERGPQALDYVYDALAPSRLTQTLEPADADVVFERPVLLVREMRELHRFENSVDDERRAETGSEAEEQHATAAVTAERLHRRVVHHLHRTAEGAAEVEAHPAGSEVPRLGERMPMDLGSGETDADVIVRPARGQPLHGGDHLASG